MAGKVGKLVDAIPAWAFGIIAAVLLASAVLGLVLGLVAWLGPDTATPTSTEGATDIRWQCTEFGDRIYWRAGYGDTFAVVAGGCRT